MPKKTAKKEPSSKKVSKKPSAATKVNLESVNISEMYDKNSVYCQHSISNYKNSIKFYKEVLELKPSKFSEDGPDPDEIGWFEFELPVKGAFLGLGKPQSGIVTPSSSLVISIKNIGEFKEAMAKKNAKPSEIMDVPNMISFLTVNDPDNNSIMFVSEPRVKS
jgi:hypothetical protein